MRRRSLIVDIGMDIYKRNGVDWKYNISERDRVKTPLEGKADVQSKPWIDDAKSSLDDTKSSPG